MMRGKALGLCLLAVSCLSDRSLAGDIDRKKLCLDKLGKADDCEHLEKDLSRIEADVRKEKKDRGWKAICLEFDRGPCVPELDIDRDGKLDRIYLMEKTSHKKLRRLIVVRSARSKLNFLEKSSDVHIDMPNHNVKFDLNELTQWRIKSGDDPNFEEFAKECDLKAGIKVLELFIDSMHHVLTFNQGRYCFMRIGD
jgi:hypothetical protein